MFLEFINGSNGSWHVGRCDEKSPESKDAARAASRGRKRQFGRRRPIGTFQLQISGPRPPPLISPQVNNAEMIAEASHHAPD